MNERRGFWFALGAILSAIAGALLWILGRRTHTPTDLTPASKLEEDRKVEETLIREQIKRESDQQLAEHFNALARGKGKKGTP